jgi:hypothetical protein
MNRVRVFVVALLGALAAAAAGACGTSQAPDSGFLEQPEKLAAVEGVPFQRVWYERGTDLSGLDSVFVAPVDVKHVGDTPGWGEFSTLVVGGEDELRYGVLSMAAYLRGRVAKAFRDESTHRFAVVTKPGANTLVLELALVELVPAKAWLNRLTAPIPFAGDTGSVAIEGRVRRGADGPVLGAFADRETGRHAVYSGRDLTWYGHAYETIDEWSVQIAALLAEGPSERTRDAAPFTLKAW